MCIYIIIIIYSYMYTCCAAGTSALDGALRRSGNGRIAPRVFRRAQAESNDATTITTLTTNYA